MKKPTKYCLAIFRSIVNGLTLALLLGFVSSLALAQSQTQYGRITNAVSGLSISFATIALIEIGKGTTSDIDGNYHLQIPEGYTGKIQVSHVSYQSISVSVDQLKAKPNLSLFKKTTALQNLIFEAGENPANPIIRKVIKNRKKNDPNKLHSYSYHTYSKEIYRLEDVNKRVDTLLFILQSKDPTTYTKNDSTALKLDSLTSRQHLLVTERVSEVKYISPRLANETVLATHVSGFKSPLFAGVGTQYQPFGFYTSTIDLMDKQYVSPINPSALHQYNYYIQDTTFYESDTVYVISFTPKPNKKMEGLTGTMSIHSQDFAITNVVATSEDPLSKITITIQQMYDKIFGQWFPVQLNTRILFKEIDIENYHLTLDNKTYLSDIDLEKTLSTKAFSDIALSFNDLDDIQQAEILAQSRVTPLDSMELSTYSTMDSLSGQLHVIENFTEILVTQRIHIGKIDFKLDDVFGYNNYEKLRLGMGLVTNQQFSKKIFFGGYTAYGFGDKAWKYGGHAKWQIHERTNTALRFTYRNDLKEVGNSPMFDEPINRVNDMVRSWNGSLFDQQVLYKASFQTRLAPFLNLQLSYANANEIPTYPYSYSHDGVNISSYQINEVSLSARYILHERYLNLYGHRMLMGYDYPAVAFKISHGNSDWLAGDFDYFQYELRMEYKMTYRLGTSFFILRSGYISGDLPYGRLITGWGNGTSSLSVPDYFQTMGLYEFLSDQAVAVFFNHNFGNLLIDTRMMKPELVVYHNVGLGDLSQVEVHKNVIFSTMTKGYLEAGIGLSNIIRFNYMDVGYFGIGVDVFYRYGAYQLANTSDNIAFKINMKFSF